MGKRHDKLVDPSRNMPRHEGLRKLTADMFKGMKKPRKKGDIKNQRNTLRRLLVNLYDRSRDDHWLAYHKDERGREYQRFSWFTAHYVKRAADHLFQESLVDARNGFFSRGNPYLSYPSRIKAAPRLREMFDRYGFNGAEIEAKPPSDLIVLKNCSGVVVDFVGSEFTITAQQHVAGLNRFLAEHRIAYPDRIIHEKFFHRVFNNGGFEYGGRFHGPIWQWREKGTRFGITIDGEPTVELDYSSMHPTMLYGLAGEKFDDDLYRVPGYPFDSDARKFLKLVTLMRINSRDTLTASQAIQARFNDYVKTRKGGWRKNRLIPKPAWLGKVKKLVEAIEDRHAPIMHLMDDKTGSRLQRYDSDICEEILLYFKSREIPVLPVHDSFIIAGKHEDELRQVMKSVFYKKFGILCKTDKKMKKN
jgi:hypothetical protein